MAGAMNKVHLPQTDSIAELAHFWDEHDLTDFEDELEEVTEPVFVRGAETTIQIQLPRQEMEGLKRLANNKGVDYTTLVQEWVRERLKAA